MYMIKGTYICAVCVPQHNTHLYTTNIKTQQTPQHNKHSTTKHPNTHTVALGSSTNDGHSPNAKFTNDTLFARPGSNRLATPLSVMLMNRIMRNAATVMTSATLPKSKMSCVFSPVAVWGACHGDDVGIRCSLCLCALYSMQSKCVHACGWYGK